MLSRLLCAKVLCDGTPQSVVEKWKEEERREYQLYMIFGLPLHLYRRNRSLAVLVRLRAIVIETNIRPEYKL